MSGGGSAGMGSPMGGQPSMGGGFGQPMGGQPSMGGGFGPNVNNFGSPSMGGGFGQPSMGGGFGQPQNPFGNQMGGGFGQPQNPFGSQMGGYGRRMGGFGGGFGQPMGGYGGGFGGGYGSPFGGGFGQPQNPFGAVFGKPQNPFGGGFGQPMGGPGGQMDQQAQFEQFQRARQGLNPEQPPAWQQSDEWKGFMSQREALEKQMGDYARQYNPATQPRVAGVPPEVAQRLQQAQMAAQAQQLPGGSQNITQEFPFEKFGIARGPQYPQGGGPGVRPPDYPLAQASPAQQPPPWVMQGGPQGKPDYSLAQKLFQPGDENFGAGRPNTSPYTGRDLLSMLRGATSPAVIESPNTQQFTSLAMSEGGLAGLAKGKK